MATHYRYVRMDDAAPAMADDGSIKMVASTDAPVPMGDWREALSHADGAVDMSAARALLINHKPDQIAGTLTLTAVDGRECQAEAKISEDARMQSGISVLDAVRSGALRGVSIGYSYDHKDAEWDRETRTLTVNRWRLLEVSLTPIPADAAASVRALPIEYQSEPPACPAGKKGSRMSEDAKPEPGVDLAAAETKAREAAISEARECVAFARSYGIDADQVIGKSMAEVKDMALARAKELLAAKPAETVVTPVKVVADEADKFSRAVADSFAANSNTRFQGGLIARKCAAFDGLRTEDDYAAARHCIQSLKFRDAANKTSASFATLLDNTAHKQLLDGFRSYKGIWQTICTVKDAQDYNLHRHLAVGIGRLTENPEGVAANEILQAASGYNSQLKRYTATLSLTVEALVNDSLSELMRSFMSTGYISARTIDREAVTAITGATWTNDTTASAPLGTAGNFDKVRADFKGKRGPTGETMENDPAILLVDPSLRYAADLATGALYGVGTGGNGMVGSNAARSMTVVDSSFLSGAATTYYLLGNPNSGVDTVTLEFLRGQRVPMISNYDSGPSGGIRMLIELPFAATIATHVDSAGNTRISGVQKATAS